MRKNSPRKWLHAILDLLPLVILPIFGLAVRSDNNFQPIEVQAQEYEVVDKNQLVNGFSNVMSSSQGELSYDGLTYTYTYNYLTEFETYGISIGTDNAIQLNKYHKYYFRGDFNVSDLNYGLILRSTNASYLFDNWFSNKIFTANYDINETLYIGLYGQVNSNIYFTFTYFNLIDLTQMFGEGNEPTATQFDNWYSGNINYTLSHKELLNVGTTTLSDTDVGSQMVYTLYNASEKYFNFRQVGNFNDIYDWIVLNMFNGNAPLIVPVVYNVILYELIMDIIFLMYAVFMFIVDFAERMLDCLFDKSFGGGR